VAGLAVVLGFWMRLGIVIDGIVVNIVGLIMLSHIVLSHFMGWQRVTVVSSGAGASPAMAGSVALLAGRGVDGLFVASDVVAGVVVAGLFADGDHLGEVFADGRLVNRNVPD
jgi:hypothetical protein